MRRDPADQILEWADERPQSLQRARAPGRIGIQIASDRKDRRSRVEFNCHDVPPGGRANTRTGAWKVSNGPRASYSGSIWDGAALVGGSPSAPDTGDEVNCKNSQLIRRHITAPVGTTSPGIIDETATPFRRAAPGVIRPVSRVSRAPRRSAPVRRRAAHRPDPAPPRSARRCRSRTAARTAAAPSNNPGNARPCDRR